MLLSFFTRESFPENDESPPPAETENKSLKRKMSVPKLPKEDLKIAGDKGKDSHPACCSRFSYWSPGSTNDSSKDSSNVEDFSTSSPSQTRTTHTVSEDEGLDCTLSRSS